VVEWLSSGEYSLFSFNFVFVFIFILLQKMHFSVVECCLVNLLCNHLIFLCRQYGQIKASHDYKQLKRQKTVLILSLILLYKNVTGKFKKNWTEAYWGRLFCKKINSIVAGFAACYII
jgi:hypothetical protein